MDGRIILFAAFLGIAYGSGHGGGLHCYECTMSRYRRVVDDHSDSDMHGHYPTPNDWVMVNGSHPSCNFDMGMPPVVTCGNKPGLQTICNISKGAYQEQHEDGMYEIEFVQRSCDYVEPERQVPECIDLLDYWTPPASWLNPWNTGCFCRGDECNGPMEMASLANHLTASIASLATIVAAALWWY